MGRSTCSIRYSERLIEEGTWASTGAVGSSYDNAAAEAPSKSYKRELIWPRSWASRDEVERATAGWVCWYITTRPHLFNPDDMAPAAVEALYDQHCVGQPAAA